MIDESIVELREMQQEAERMLEEKHASRNIELGGLPNHVGEGKGSSQQEDLKEGFALQMPHLDDTEVPEASASKDDDQGPS